MKELKKILMNVHGYELNQILVLENIVIGSRSVNGLFTNSVASYGSDGKIWVRDYTSEVKIVGKMHTHESIEIVEDIVEIETSQKREVLNTTML